MSIVLVFPPIVTTGFGSYYPSIAVLAGHLKAANFNVSQIDLNQQLARHLLSVSELAAIGEGMLPGWVGPPLAASSQAAAARLLTKNIDAVIDIDGRITSTEGALGVGFLLPIASKTLQVDESVRSILDRVAGSCPISEWYRSFYASSSVRSVIEDKSVKLLGISIPMGPQLLPSLLLVEFVKRERPDIRVVIGGATVSLMADADLDMLLREAPYLDAVVRYEGEGALLNLSRQLEAGRWSLGDVGNVSYVNPMGMVHHCPPIASPSLNELAFAEYSPELLSGLQDAEIGIIQTRGCYWGKCAYCDFVELYEGSPRYRTRSPESFVSEIEYQVKRHGVKKFSLITEAIPPSFSRRFSILMIEKGLNIRWNSFAMVDDHFTDEHFLLMRKSGCESLVIGLETMVDRVLSLVHKYASAAQNVSFLRRAKSARLSLAINLIPNLPTTTYKEALHALELLETVEDAIDTVSVFPFEATRSSRIGKNPGKYGLVPVVNQNASGQALFAANHLAVLDEGMNSDELERVLALYRAFADKVNAKKFTTLPAPSIAACSGKAFRVASESFDLVLEGDEAKIFHCRTRESWTAPAFVGAMVDRLSSIGPTIGGEVLHAICLRSPEVVSVLQSLADARILVPVDDCGADFKLEDEPRPGCVGLIG
jgi:hypothetical protein